MNTKLAKTKQLKEKTVCSILSCHHTKPLKLWNKKIRGGHINQLVDRDLYCSVLEIFSLKSPNTYITCPADQRKVLGIRAPFLHFTLKNLGLPVFIDVLVKDNKNVERRFRAMTRQRETQLNPFTCTMPLTLEQGWNDVTVPLGEFTKKAYGTRYVETLRVQMHATCRVHSVYFSHTTSPEDFVRIVK